MKLLATGWKHSKGEFNGNAYNYAVLYVQTKMEQKDNQRGSAGIEMRGVPELAEKLAKLPFNEPMYLEVTTEPRAIGKGQFVETVIDVAPIANQAGVSVNK